MAITSKQDLVHWPKIKEAETHTIALNIPQSQWDKITVLRNGSETLELRVHKQQLHFVWPFSSVGLYKLIILNGPQALIRHQLWVAPRLFSPPQVHLILQDLHQHLPFSLALRSQGKGKVGLRFSLASSESAEQALLRLKNIWFGSSQNPGIEFLLACFPHAYPFQLESSLEWGKLSNAKKLPQSTWQKQQIAPQETGYKYTPHIQYHDAFVQHMSAFLKNYMQALRQVWVQSPKTETPWIESTLNKIEAHFISKGLDKLPPPSTRLRNRFHPRHQDWFYWFKQFSFVPFPDIYLPVGTGFLMDMPHLYQYWISLHVFSSFCRWVNESDFVWRLCNPTHEVYPYHTLKRGKSPWGICVHGDLELAFYIERAFSPKDEIRTHKFRQIPDISLIISKNKRPIEMVIFEIKYKANLQQGVFKEDLDKLHAYRDALRHEGSLLVKKAILLTPAPTELLSPDFMVVQGHPNSLASLYQCLYTQVWSRLTL